MFGLGDRNIYLNDTFFEGDPQIQIKKHPGNGVTEKIYSQKKGVALKVGEWAKLKDYIQNIDLEVARLQQLDPNKYMTMSDLQTALDYL